MNNWKISKLRIQGFKAFTSVEFDFEAASLITLEGPNGYGKTTVYDAVELLFTGGISRISSMFSAVMSAKQKNYRDNLYWNTKESQAPLCIKAELKDDAGNVLVFARMATIADLTHQANNRADKFDIFKLYKLASYDDENFGQPLASQHLDEYFGRNFCKNYPMLNYLQQGQNAFVFATTISERKAALENLLETTAIREQIDLCAKVERRLSQLNSEAEQSKISELKLTVENLKKISNSGEDTKKFVKVSTQEPVPEWDSPEPFPLLDEDRYSRLTSQIELLCKLSKVKEEIAVRRRNLEIEQYISDKGSVFSLAIAIGKHIHRFEDLHSQKARIDGLSKALVIMSAGANSIKYDQLTPIEELGFAIDPSISSRIVARDDVAKHLNSKSIQLVDLQRVREDLFTKHEHSNGADAAWCPLCGQSWQDAVNLKKAFDHTTQVLSSEQEQLAQQLSQIIATIEAVIGPVKLLLEQEKISLESGFEKHLYDELARNRQSFDTLRRFNERLRVQNVDYESDYTAAEPERAIRKESLVLKIRALKSKEGDPPPAGWESALQQAFASYADFEQLESAHFEQKKLYIELCYRERQDKVLQETIADLENRQRKLQAVTRAKVRIAALKGVLTKAEKDYSSRTIGDIELVFHIYSGRLIQNYQRGLGLFIEQGDGNKVQFSTAERSEHDATLSMSSGQLCALSLAFFLSLNRVYSKTPFVLIDDPAQSLDEINIASLTDLLRCELSDRQLIMSTHEDEIASYMRYRFLRAGLSQKPFNMQLHIESGAEPAEA